MAASNNNNQQALRNLARYRFNCEGGIYRPGAVYPPEIRQRVLLDIAETELVGGPMTAVAARQHVSPAWVYSLRQRLASCKVLDVVPDVDDDVATGEFIQAATELLQGKQRGNNSDYIIGAADADFIIGLVEAGVAKHQLLVWLLGCMSICLFAHLLAILFVQERIADALHMAVWDFAFAAPQIYLHELCTAFEENTGISISVPTMCAFLNRIGLRRRAITRVNKHRFDPEARDQIDVDSRMMNGWGG